MPVNIRDIARESKVSITTVSRVLHNNSNVNDATRQRVLKVIKRLKYDPFTNIPLARTRELRNLGLVTPYPYLVTDPFFSRAIRAVKEAALEQGNNLILYSQQEVEEKLADAVGKGSLHNECGGLIYFCPLREWETQLRALVRRSIPVALVGRSTGVRHVGSVTVDSAAGITRVMEYLYGLGHRQIGFIGRDDPQLGRHGSYRSFMESNRLPIDESWVFMERADAAKYHGWLDHLAGTEYRPTAIVCYDDLMALNLISALQKRGIRVPEDISVTGFNDDHVAELTNPAITSVRYPVEEMCRYACRLLQDAIDGLNAPRVAVTFEHTIVERGSCTPV